ncbi:MAG: glutamate--cysteine ligase, partial [Micrococcaceae bacterium]|nr:glutamate--cysteine ligase [Micrococcaceae bacterium]
MQIDFADSRQSTLGVEWEVALVDHHSGDLRSVAQQVLEGVHAAHGGLAPDEEHPHVKQELLLNTVEIVTDVCDTVRQAKTQLHENLGVIREVTDPMGIDLYSAGSHPFASPKLQPVTDQERYAKLIDRTQWWGQQMVIYGVHVHVGLDRRDKALPVVDGLMNYQPHFQALSASSPFWGGEDTGYASHRALMFQQLPTAGLPYHFETWSQFEGYVADMLHTGVIDDISEIRWDVRPVPRFGTVEMRICDGLSSLQDIGAIAALTQCLVDDMSTTLDDGGSIDVMPPWHRTENKWRAARYGMDAIIILNAAGDEMLVTDHLMRELDRLEPV